MRLADLFTAPPSGHMDVQKTWTNVGGVILSAGFVKQAWAYPLSFDVFLGYATALAIVTTPALAAKFLGLRYGQTQTPESTSPQGATS